MKRKLMALSLIGLLMAALLGCDAFVFPFFTTNGITTTHAVKTIDFSGTITVLDSDYQSYAIHHLVANDMAVDAYNDVLIDTQIGRAHV